MAITILRNQPIDFNAESDGVDCGCGNKPFCQLIDPTDATQFQILSSDLVVNGVFDNEGEGWVTSLPFMFTIDSISNETAEGECDGAATVSVSNYTGVVQMSLNGGALSPEPGYLILEDLCAGYYYITAIDEDGNQGSLEFYIYTNVDCGDYDSTDELLPFTTGQLLNCLTLDFI